METTEYFRTRRTIRRYTQEPVGRDELNDMLACAAQAPTCGNMQLYSVIVTTSVDGKKALAPAHFNQPSVMSAAAVLTFCADFNRFGTWCRQRGADPGYDNFQSLVSAMLDTVILAQQFCTVAEMRGLGTCYLGTTAWNAPQIADALALPAMVVPVITVTVGHPDEAGVESDRIPLDGFVHTETYHEYTAADIDRIYGPKEALPESHAYVAENGKETLAQVFTDVRYPRDANEHFSDILYAFIERAGFHWPK